jgi:hypothetical protein
MTELYAYDVSGISDRLWIQRPANAGTLISPVSTGLRLRSDMGFDIAGVDNVGWIAGTKEGRSRNSLWRLDVNSGEAKSMGRIGDGTRVITGLAAVQDQDQ